MVSQYWQDKRRKSARNFGKNIMRTAGSPSPINMARLAWSGVKGLRALVNAEKHFVDGGANGTIAAATGTVIDFSQIAQGDTISTRTGNSILVNNIQLRSLVTFNASATNTLVRAFLVQDLQQVADTPPTAASILDSVSPLAPLNRLSLGRYKIIMNKKFILDSQHPTKVVNFYRKFKKHHFRYNGTAVGDIQKGGLYIVFVHNEATNLPSINYSSTTVFYDN